MTADKAAHIPDDVLAFYANQSLPQVVRQEVEAHLPTCPDCRMALAEWMALADGLRESAPGSGSVPEMSPVIRSVIHAGRPSLAQSARSAWNLVWAQRVFVFQGISVPVLSAVVLIAILAALILQGSAAWWPAVSLFTAIPIAGAVVAAFLYRIEDDPALELISALPTEPGTLIFARLTLALGALALLALAGSLVVAAFGGDSPLGLVTAWLGPMLLLSALTTLLAVAWRPQLAAGVSLMLWGGLVVLMARELGGASFRGFSLLMLLQPGWQVVSLELLFAVIFFCASWLWITRGSPASSLTGSR